MASSCRAADGVALVVSRQHMSPSPAPRSSSGDYGQCTHEHDGHRVCVDLSIALPSELRSDLGTDYLCIPMRH
jgi:hypothetical protein